MIENKKYEITNISCTLSDGTVLYKIKALKDFYCCETEFVKKGSLGGYIESERNLAQEGTCWIFNGIVKGFATVLDDALIDGNITISDDSSVYGNSKIINKNGSVSISDSSTVKNSSIICDSKIKVQNFSHIENSDLKGNLEIFGASSIYSKVHISDEEYVEIKDGIIKCDRDFIHSEIYLPNEGYLPIYLYNTYNQNFCIFFKNTIWEPDVLTQEILLLFEPNVISDFLIENKWYDITNVMFKNIVEDVSSCIGYTMSDVENKLIENNVKYLIRAYFYLKLIHMITYFEKQKDTKDFIECCNLDLKTNNILNIGNAYFYIPSVFLFIKSMFNINVSTKDIFKNSAEFPSNYFVQKNF